MVKCITPIVPMSLIHVDRSAAWVELVADTVKPWREFRYSGHAATLAQADELLRTTQPDLLLLEPWLPDGDGLAFVSALRRRLTRTRIVACTDRSDEVMLHEFDRLKLDGMVWKEVPLSRGLRPALAVVHGGGRYFPPELAGMRRELRTNPAAWFKLLSDREVELLPRLAAGETDEAIAGVVGLSAHTVHSHRQSIMRKLELHRTVDLMVWAEERGFRRPSWGRVSRQDHIFTKMDTLPKSSSLAAGARNRAATAHSGDR